MFPTHLLLLSALQIPPLLRYVAEVDLVHGNLDVTDGVVFGEAIEIINGHHQGFTTQLHVGNLRENKKKTNKSSQERQMFTALNLFLYNNVRAT